MTLSFVLACVVYYPVCVSFKISGTAKPKYKGSWKKGEKEEVKLIIFTFNKNLASLALQKERQGQTDGHEHLSSRCATKKWRR